ncbi:type II secretion system F family protein [Nitrincola sp.]|uniref:type II secretion system F family protein n=1 Tax=Nitrincola sp. TaxID=1926584 RepID=UPI003A92E3A5
MAVFQYRARRGQDRVTEGRLTADSAEAAASQLLTNGLIPLDIRLATSDSSESLSDQLNKLMPPRKVTLDELILFSRQMYSITKAGVPLIQGLSRLSESMSNPRLGEILREISRDLEGGRDVAGSFGRHRKVFGTLYISLLQVGEMTGQMDRVFLTMHDYLARDRDTANKIKSATRYPMFVIIAITIAIGVLTTVVIPAFAQVFDSVKMDLPLPTIIILAVSDFATQWWLQILIAIGLGILAFRYWSNTERGRYLWDRTKLKFPKVGNILLRATIARFVRAFGVALQSGVPITQALAGVAATTGNTYITEKILSMQSGIERGDSILRTAASAQIFTPVVLQMVAVGEETGQLDAMMLEVADFYDREVAYDIDNLSSIIEPILTVAVGVIVLILALGIFLPMWDLTQLAGR